MKRKNDDLEVIDAKRGRQKLLQMQIDDLFDDLLVSDNNRTSMEELAETIKHSIQNATQDDIEYKLDDLDWFKKRGLEFPLVLPFNIKLSAVKSSRGCQWIRPHAVEILRCWFIGNTMKDEAVIDLNVIISKRYFDSRDFLNFAYFVKRAHYVCRVADILRKANLTVKYSFDQQDTLRPILIVTKPNSLTETTRVRIYFSPSCKFAKHSRFGPEKNNLRPSFCKPSWNAAATLNDDIPTPNYNTKIITDMLRSETEAKFAEFFIEKSNFFKAFVIIKCWMLRRSFMRPDGFNDSLLKAWFIMLHQQGRFGDQSSAFDLIFAFFSSIVSTNWNEMQFSLNCDMHVESLLQFKKHFEFVFLDFTGSFNLASSLSAVAVDNIRAAASDTLQKLDHFDEFDNAFILEHRFNYCFDYYIRILLTKNYLLDHLSKKYPAECIDACSDQSMIFTKHLTPLLKKAWSERALYFDYNFPNQRSLEREVSDKFFSDSASGSDIRLLIGIRLGSDWNETLMRGPPAKSLEAEDFRKFWGNNCELRKFADNAICEAVVWSNSKFGARVPLLICKCVVEMHLQVDKSCIEERTFSDTLVIPGASKRYETISKTYDKLCRCLRSAENLPLAITNIQQVSPFLRQTSPKPPPSATTVSSEKIIEVVDSLAMPTPNVSPPFCPSVRVFLVMEQSGKWGNDMGTIARLKTAFYIELSKLLANMRELRAVPFKDFLIIQLDEVVFRLEIAYQREVFLMRKLNGASTGTLKDCEASRKKELDIILEPQLAALLYSVSQKFPAFSETCRLLAIWLSSFMLSDYIDDIILETIAASVFLKPFSTQAPRTAFVAFMHCLDLLANHNWLMKPLFVDFNGDWTEEDTDKMHKDFIKLRPVLPAMVICTCADTSGSRWTRHEPQPLVLKRIISLASSSSSLLSKHIEQVLPINLKSLFLPDVSSIFDVLIEIRGSHQTQKRTVCAEANNNCLPVFDYDEVASYVQRLRDEFHSVALFFYNKYSGDKIGVLWKPSSTDKKNANISSCLHRYMESDGLLILNKAAVLEDFKIMGKGIVRDIIPHARYSQPTQNVNTVATN